MEGLVALDYQAHKHLKVDVDRVEELSAHLNMIPVILDEFSQLVVQHPILFAKNENTGQFVCVALTGLEKGENLFWSERGSSSLYTPLKIARNPLFVGANDASAGEEVLCLDSNSAIIGEKGTELFTAEGQPSQYLKHMQTVLQSLVQGEHATNEFIKTLLSLSLLSPLKLDITYENGESSILNGLYSINQDKLNELTEEEFNGVRAKGYLQPIYTQLASLGQIYALIDKKNKRQAQQ